MRICCRRARSRPSFTLTAAMRSCPSRTTCRTSKVFQPNSEAQMKPSTGNNPAPGFKKYPDNRIETKAAGVRVQVTFNGEVIADSGDAIRLEEGDYPAVFYFPRKDVKMDRLRRTTHSTHCPFKGDASYFS